MIQVKTTRHRAATCRVATSLLSLATLGSLLCACPDEGPGASPCIDDSDCKGGEVCTGGNCSPRRQTDGGTSVACNSNEECQAIDPDFICNPSGLCEEANSGPSCTTTAECPIEQFCNVQTHICTPLQSGFCRQESQCAGLKCSASPGGVGRCVECLAGSDCGSGRCLPNGTCAEATECNPPCTDGYRCEDGQCKPIGGDCNPPCDTDEECVQGVCYGANGCPRNAHPEGDQCTCDDGYQVNQAGNACVPLSCDPTAQQSCQQNGGTWDSVNCTCMGGGSCSPPCPTGTVCQGDQCVPITSTCEADEQCYVSETDFFYCDLETNQCTCDSTMGALMCMMYGFPWIAEACDCDFTPPPPDAGPPDLGTEDVQPIDAGTQDTVGIDAGRPDAGADGGDPDAGWPTGADLNPGWVGGACDNSGDCWSGHYTVNPICMIYGFEEGMCTQPCTQNATSGAWVCPDEPTYEDPTSPYTITRCVDEGNGLPRCIAECDFDKSPTGCRTGYVCVLRQRYGTTDKIFPVCLPAATEGWPNEAPPLFDIGEPCGTASDCGYLTCVEQWPGGYCTRTNCDQSSCPAGSACDYYYALGGYACFKSCEEQVDCREGYTCDSFNECFHY